MSAIFQEEETKVDSQLQANRDEMVRQNVEARINAEQAELDQRTAALAEARAMYQNRYAPQAPAEVPTEEHVG